MKKTQNPQAFPTHNDTRTQDGMDLLDYFAGQAVISFLIAAGLNGKAIPDVKIASDSYDIAETMVKEREKRNET